MRSLAVVAVLGAGACSFSAAHAPGDGDVTVDMPDSPPPSTLRRIQLTFHNAGRAETLVSFPALVALTPAKIDYAAIKAGGADLRFFDPDGTALPYEIERWDPAGRSLIWVRVPAIDASSDADFIWVQYGDPSAVDAQDAAAVWSDEHVAVWHLDEDPGPGGVDEIRDSTANGHHGTASASMTAANLVDGVDGKAITFTPGADFPITTSASAAYTLPVYTWTLWLNATAAPTMAVNRDVISNGDRNFNFAWDHTSAGYAAANAQNDGTSWSKTSVGPAVTGGVWYHVAATYNGSSMCVYLDAVLKACVAAPTPAIPLGGLSIGGYPTNTINTFSGAIDEVRVSSVARSTARIGAEYATEKDDVNVPFVTFGMPEAVP